MRKKFTNYQSLFLWSHRILDLLTPMLLLFFLAEAKHGSISYIYIIAGLTSGLLMTITAQFCGTYTDWRGRSLFFDSQKIVGSWLFCWLIMVAATFVMKSSAQFSREVWILWAFLTSILLVGYRVLIKLLVAQARKIGVGNKNIMILGAGDAGVTLAKSFIKNPWMGYEVIGFLDDDKTKLHSEPVKGLRVLGPIKNSVGYCQELGIRQVFICLPESSNTSVFKILDEFSKTAIVPKYVPNLPSLNLLQSSIEFYEGIPVVSVFDFPLNRRTNATVKRVEDICLAFLALLIFSPIMFFLALCIKLNDNGPIFFTQTRHGRAGKEFNIYKFRSMTNADDGPEIKQAVRNDKRFTKVGAFMRRTSLDELPQLFNVIIGNMSMVGPRPHAKAHNEMYKGLIKFYMLRHITKPGITGYAQILGHRGETDTLEKMQRRVEADIFYIKNWSIAFDIKIILKTLAVGFVNRNAY
ncbi:undecaprenyl-phosphate glucose phosphotransferase [Alphaproteobacteria bacterium]|nr:undecaprenyl-phosphate glucose phosphotransferase [Alphaproteobacteria bacterium]